MHQRKGFRLWREFHRPVEGGVAAAEHQQALAAIGFRIPHPIEHLPIYERLDAVHPQRHRLEGTHAAGDHHRAGVERFAGAGSDVEAAVVDGFHFRYLSAQVEGGLERPDLAHQPIHQFLRVAHRNAGNVVDGLVRVQLGALAAWCRHGVHHMGANAEQAQLEYLEQAAWPGANDDDIGTSGQRSSSVWVAPARAGWIIE